MRPIPAGTACQLLCRLLEVGRSAYYAYRAGREAAQVRQEAEDELAGEIRHIHAESRGAYGAPRVTAVLRRGGRPVNRKKVERIMRERGIRGITRRRRRSLTQADTNAVPSPDLVGRDFTAAEPGTRLVSDITYLPSLAGWWTVSRVILPVLRSVRCRWIFAACVTCGKSSPRPVPVSVRTERVSRRPCPASRS